jgi:hypothetical protein
MDENRHECETALRIKKNRLNNGKKRINRTSSGWVASGELPGIELGPSDRAFSELIARPESKDVMREKLLLAIEHTDGFGIV